MQHSKAIEDYQHAQLQQKKQFKACFGTPDGKEVLRVLREEFYDCYIAPDDNLAVGQRDVIYQILTRLDEI